MFQKFFKKSKKFSAQYYYPFGEFVLTATETLVSLKGLVSTPLRVIAALGLGGYTAIETRAFQVPYITGEREEGAYFIEPSYSRWRSLLKWFVVYPSVISVSLLQKFCENYTIWMSTRAWINAIHGDQDIEEMEPLSDTELGLVLAWTFLIDLPFAGLTGIYALCQEQRERWNLPATEAPDFIKRIANSNIIRPLVIYPGSSAEALETAFAVGALVHPSLLRENPWYFAPLILGMGATAGSSYYQARLFDGSAVEENLRDLGQNPSSAEDTILNIGSQNRIRVAQFLLWLAVPTNALFAMLPPTEYLLEECFDDRNSSVSYIVALMIATFAAGIPVTWGVYQSEIKTALSRCQVQDENLGIIAGRKAIIQAREENAGTEMEPIRRYGTV